MGRILIFDIRLNRKLERRTETVEAGLRPIINTARQIDSTKCDDDIDLQLPSTEEPFAVIVPTCTPVLELLGEWGIPPTAIVGLPTGHVPRYNWYPQETVSVSCTAGAHKLLTSSSTFIRM